MQDLIYSSPLPSEAMEILFALPAFKSKKYFCYQVCSDVALIQHFVL